MLTDQQYAWLETVIGYKSRKPVQAGAGVGSGGPARKTSTAPLSPRDTLEQSYQAAVKAAEKSNDWKEAARLLNGFEPGDIQRRLNKLSDEQLARIHNGAIAVIGPTSNVARMTEKTDVISADLKDRKMKLITAADFISNRAAINAEKFAGQVGSACQTFQNYAAGRIEQIKGELTGGDFAEALASVVLGVVGGEIAGAAGGRIGSKVAESIIKGVNSVISKKMTEKAKSAAGNGDDVKALGTAVASISDGARESAAGIIDSVTKAIDGPVGEIKRSVNSGERLTADQEDFLGPFYEATPETVDAELQRLGIPNVASAKKIYLKIYEGLVKKFETLVYTSQYTSQDRSIRTSKQLELEADAMADKRAVEERKKHE